MIRWAVHYVLGRNDCSWSLENVPTKATRALMAELAAAHPERVAYGVFDSADFGAPQNRLRLIAGPPKLIRTCCKAFLALGVCPCAMLSTGPARSYRRGIARIRRRAKAVDQQCAPSRHRALPCARGTP
jgi:hypothetical protein